MTTADLKNEIMQMQTYRFSADDPEVYINRRVLFEMLDSGSKNYAIPLKRQDMTCDRCGAPTQYNRALCRKCWEELDPMSPYEWTNADAIRAMTDEEFAHWLWWKASVSVNDPRDWLDWLKSPVEVEAE